MKTNKLLVAAVLAIAVGAPIAGFVGEIERGTADDIRGDTGSVPARRHSTRHAGQSRAGVA